MKATRKNQEGKCADTLEIVFSDDDAAPAATGASEQEARSKLVKKLRKLCKRTRKEQSKECAGKCGTESRRGNCWPRTRYTADDAISCFPTDLETGDGYICVYFGRKLFCDCICVDTTE